MSGRPVPWASWEEWHALREDLWSPDPARQESGLQQVSAWRLRGKLPLGVDATAHLLDVSAALSASHESSFGSSWPVTVDEMCITWLYRSTSISFSTTTLPETDTCGRRAGGGGRSRRIGSAPGAWRRLEQSGQRKHVGPPGCAVGLPRALVDVRHEATHSELPSLPLLRAAAEAALGWLRDSYWDGQCRALAAAEERIRSLLTCLADSWRAAAAAGLSGGGGGAAADDEDDEEEGGEEATGSAAAYSGAEGQRARKAAVSELRSLVTPAFSAVLLGPLLDCTNGELGG
ncbi:LAS1-like protein [Tetrabaena socialis]|uniref:LAS1-like protein n=1 Tax=Tetrabaena socialis TaxID=47790 RepID=A0A2J8AE81_9CHLO|nr:LAS1-like protein [Tetrabaena socialis]|eukprot:PNH10806.1 LAS1-like protein [Tetrabaena socialis]